MFEAQIIGPIVKEGWTPLLYIIGVQWYGHKGTPLVIFKVNVKSLLSINASPDFFKLLLVLPPRFLYNRMPMTK